MKFAVTGATGSQQAPVVQTLLAQGHEVRGLARGPAPQSIDGLTWYQGELSDTALLRSLLDGVDGLAFHLPVGSPGWDPTPLLDIAAEVGVPHLVFNASARVPSAAEGGGPVRDVVDGMASRALSATVLEPTLYLENLLLPFVVKSLEEGVLRYPLPADGFDVAWVASADLGAFAAQALLSRKQGTFAAASPTALSGNELADALGEGLGRAIRYEAITPEDFARPLATLIGEDAAANVRGLYEGIGGAPAHFQPWLAPQGERAADALGVAATTVPAWAAAIQAPQRTS